MKNKRLKFFFQKPSLTTVLVFCGVFFPLTVLFVFNVFHATAVYRGKEVIFPIYGYDPRDLLSGHYLTFRIDFKETSSCSDVFAKESYRLRAKQLYFCTDSRDFAKSKRECGGTAIAGFCSYRDFHIGLSRFYIPEAYAETLDLLLRQSSRTKQKMKIVLSVTSSGRAYAKDLLIDDRPWKEWIKNPVFEEDRQEQKAVSPASDDLHVLEEDGEKIILKVPKE